MSSPSSMIRPFLAGAVSALSLVYMVSKLPRKRDLNRNEHIKQQPRDSSLIMDSPDLDQRIIRKAEAAIRKRTSRLTVVVERCTNDFNYSAILRTVEALGIQNVYIIAPPTQATLDQQQLKRSTGQVVKRASAEEVSQRKTHHLFAQRAAEWLTIQEFDDTTSCLEALRRTNHVIWATDLSQQAECLTAEGLTLTQGSLIPEKLAIVFGTEAVGCTQEMLEAADKRVYLPLYGFADSLNLSVATALVVQQLMHLDPTLVGSMTEEERRELRQAWFTKLASQRLVSSKQKKERQRIISQIKTCEEIQEKQENGHTLQKGQVSKLEKMPLLQQQVKDMDETINNKARASIQGLVDHPPEPLDDMRRADEHRTCYVGRNTKNRHDENWKDMPATKYYDTSKVKSTADYFRNLAAVNNVSSNGEGQS